MGVRSSLRRWDKREQEEQGWNKGMNSKKDVQHVYLVGAKSLGAYGGYETFVYKLTEYHQNKENIKYHVACKANGDGCMDESKFDGVTKINEHEFELHNAHCFKIDVPQIGPAQAIYYDVAALKACCEHIKENHIPHPIVYIMACRIGPFAGYFYKEIHKLGGTVYLNPDGHEWMRAKWSAPIRKYWKISEQTMVKYCDLAICDSVNIEKYIHECYDGKGIKGRNPKTTFIAYGADLTLSKLADDDEKLVNWYKEKGLTKKGYYLVVGRFVPENSFEVMIREFMKSKSKKDFAIITNVNDKFLNELEEKLHFKSDERIKFVGTVYDQELLKKIRENAYAYFHGHTVGGTNPFMAPKFSDNIILTKTERLMMSNRPPDPKNARNKNVLVVGGSGSGKTRFWLKPNLLQCHSSYVVTDPKGTIVLECGNAMLKNGYKVRILNTINFKKSMHYNPFSYVHSEKDILKLVTTLMTNTKGEGSGGDPFWEKSERLLLTALIAYLHYEAPVEEQNFATLLEMLNTMQVLEDDEEYQNPVDLLFEELAKKKPNSFAGRQYKLYKLAAGVT